MSLLNNQFLRCQINADNGSITEPSISFVNAPTLGFYLKSSSEVSLVFEGSEVLNLSSGGILGPSSAYSGSSSFQVIAPDLELAAGAGKNVADGTAYLAPIMGNLIGDSLTKTGNYLGGVIGALSVTGTKASHYPVGAVLAQISDTVTEADGAVVAYVDGDSGVTKANAAFKAMSNNSMAGSGFNYGLDLTSPAHDGYNALAILKADLRLSNDVCTFQGSGAPVDGVSGTGAGFAGPGSFYIRVAGASSDAYINCNTKASPTWKLITRAA